ncbi:retrotransposon gag protein [Cucumis melo var. makuwa]|uniref:Retrotransposon gag protein n=1 Tax=Cucumis melo var. makuwa TaxID=1194695 RepID=A0A5A7V464_CUCMM|nr:retrotransposon gag protein [Cucumis melo var. makuwa]
MGGLRRNNSRSKTYNSRWRDYPNLRWCPQDPKPTNTSTSSSSSRGTHLEEIISKLALSSNGFKIDFEKNLAKPAPPRKEFKNDEEILKVFKKVEVNFPS